MRIISQDGLVDIPYDNAAIAIDERINLPFDGDIEEEPDGFDIVAYMECGRFFLGETETRLAALDVVERMRQHYRSGFKTVYIQDLLTSVERERCAVEGE